MRRYGSDHHRPPGRDWRGGGYDAWLRARRAMRRYDAGWSGRPGRGGERRGGYERGFDIGPIWGGGPDIGYHTYWRPGR